VSPTPKPTAVPELTPASSSTVSAVTGKTATGTTAKEHAATSGIK